MDFKYEKLGTQIDMSGTIVVHKTGSFNAKTLHYNDL